MGCEKRRTGRDADRLEGSLEERAEMLQRMRSHQKVDAGKAGRRISYLCMSL